MAFLPENAKISFLLLRQKILRVQNYSSTGQKKKKND